MAEISLDGIETAEYMFGDTVTITVTKCVDGDYSISVDDGGTDLAYRSLPFQYHSNEAEGLAVFERDAGITKNSWFAERCGIHKYMNEEGRYDKHCVEFFLNCARDGVNRLIDMGYIVNLHKPIKLCRDHFNQMKSHTFEFHGVKVHAVPTSSEDIYEILTSVVIADHEAAEQFIETLRANIDEMHKAGKLHRETE